ncbi:MAG TPA: glycosyltransferase family 39 protein [Solirubrobacteraceae bacterium]|nr:glycosyltransferase family 39 protein [Solirubrobacteraceae bacterium]
MAIGVAPPTTAPTPSAPSREERLAERLDRLRARAAAVPTWLWCGAGLLLLMAASAYIRSRYLANQFWMDEAITTGIATHPLLSIPHILRFDGNPPLFYMLLHIWVSWFGDSETATHSLSLLFGVLTVPVAGLGGAKLFGRRTGIYAAVLFALNAWLTSYAQETRMYELVALEGAIATTAMVLAFVQRRRRWLPVFGAMLTAMLYTHSWGTFFFVGSAIALVPALLASEERRAFFRDAFFTYLVAGILYLPWLPTLLFQAAHTAAPWDRPPRFGAPIQISRNVIGGDRITVILVFAAVVGLGPLFTRRHRRTREGTTLWTLIVLPIAVLAIAWIGSQVTPAWSPRYFAPVIPAMLFLIAWGCARARVLGVAAMLLAVWFLHTPSAFAPQRKSNMKVLAAELAPDLHRGDLVIVGQPEQTPLAWYYLPAGLRFTNTASHGRILADPRYMNWVDALHQIRTTRPVASVDRLVGELRPGQQLLFIRPLTEGVQNWKAPWTYAIHLRSAQWGAALTAEVANGALSVRATAPATYREACCVADSAILYRKR